MELPPFPEVFGNYAIQGIEEIDAPGPISWLPETLGWQLLAVFLLLYLMYWGRRRWQYWLRNRYRKAALRQLDNIMLAPTDTRTRLAAMAALLKATALQAYPRREIAALSGADWIQWLDQHTDDASFGSQANLLDGQMYRANWAPEASELVAFKQSVATWIRDHREPEPND